MTTAEIRAPRKAKAILNNLVEGKQLTEEGLCWLTNATDPFHDTQVRPCGLPDVNTSPTLVQCFTQTASLSNPQPASSAPWDAHVWLNPVTSSPDDNSNNPFVRMGLNPRLGILTALPATVNVYPGFNAISVPSNTDWQKDPTIPAYSTIADRIGLPNGSCSGQSRVVAMGFEVVNTTPELYRGGSVTSYRSPSTVNTTLVGSSTIGQGYTIPTVTLPPSLQKEAQLYPTSRTWGAEEGVYSISTLNDTEHPFLPQKAGTTLVTGSYSAVDLTASSGTVFPVWGNGIFISGPPVFADCTRPLPFDVNGAIFTGLSPQTTLQVTTKYYIERVPTLSQPDLLVLTRPPTPYDPMAMEIYTRAIQELPVACMVKDNPLGEWFNDVLSAVAEYAPKVGSIFGPIGSTVGTAIGGGAALALRNRQPQQPRKKRPAQRQQVMQQQHNPAPRTQRAKNKAYDIPVVPVRRRQKMRPNKRV